MAFLSQSWTRNIQEMKVACPADACFGGVGLLPASQIEQQNLGVGLSQVFDAHIRR